MIGNAVLSALIRVPNEDRVQHRIITQTNLIGKFGLRFKAVKVIDNFLVFVFSGKSLYDAKLILNIMDQHPLIIILHLKHVIVIYIGFLFLKPQLQRRAIVVDFLDLIIYRQNNDIHKQKEEYADHHQGFRAAGKLHGYPHIHDHDGDHHRGGGQKADQ